MARRFHFDLAIWPELYQLKGKKAKLFGCWPSFSCMDCDECDISWNKFGRITYLNGTFVNDNKLHVGWRADPENIKQLKLGAYFHELAEDEPYFVCHYITNVNIDTEVEMDMYMSTGTIGLILRDQGLVLRKSGMIPNEKKSSSLKRTFYFGDGLIYKADNCLSTKKMKIDFRNQEYDKDGFADHLNKCKHITVNISKFIDGDEHEFYAYETMWGSVPDGWQVDYETGHPNKIKQQCIIKDGADITFSASESIHLKHGFRAKSGSNFRAKIVQKKKPEGYYDKPKKLNLPPLEQEECNNFGNPLVQAQSMETGENSIKFTGDYQVIVYPNPTNGLINISLSFEKKFKNKYLQTKFIYTFAKKYIL